MSLKNEVGNIAWYSLMTHNPSTAIDYYTKLLSWEVMDYEIEGFGKAKLFQAAGQKFAGPMDLNDVKELPSHWIPYFAVESVDEKCQQIKSLAGEVCFEPFDMPTIGRTAIVSDPQGTVFQIFTPEDPKADVNVMGGSIGQPCWLELMAKDPKSLATFYGTILSLEVEEQDMGEGAYFIIKKGDHMVAGITAVPEGFPETKYWLPYFMVTDAEASSSISHELGGESLSPARTISGVGTFTLQKDPTGALFYLFQGE